MPRRHPPSASSRNSVPHGRTPGLLPIALLVLSACSAAGEPVRRDPAPVRDEPPGAEALLVPAVGTAGPSTPTEASAVAARHDGSPTRTEPGPRGRRKARVSKAAAPTASEPPAPQPAPTGPPPRLVISEIQPDPLLLDDGAGEYLEVVHLGPAPVRLADLAVVLPSGKVAVPERPSAPVLLPGEVVVLTPLGLGTGEARLRGMRLPNPAGRVELRWRQQVVDAVQWHRRWPWPKAQAGKSLERKLPGADGTTGRAWRHATTPLRGIERGSPGRVTWPCSVLAGTALAARCPPVTVRPASAPTARSRRQNAKSRAEVICPAPGAVAGAGFEPAT